VFTKVVARSEPLKRTTEVPTKFEPLTVIMKLGSPTLLVVGTMPDVVGTGFVTVRSWLFDVPPAGVGLKTVIGKMPAAAISDAGIEAVTWVELTSVVDLFTPLNRTIELELKFVPLTVSVNPDAPANLLAGEMSVVVGTGLFTVKVCVLELPPPGAGFTTLTKKIPATARSEVAMAAVTCVEFTKVVVREEPAHCTTDVAMKFVPFTVKLNPASPAVALVVPRLVVVGTGLLTWKLTEFDVPPPGAGVKTVMGNVPAVAISEVEIVAVSWLPETYVVGRSEPFQRTIDVEDKFVPLTVKVKAEPPAKALDGAVFRTTGAGLAVWFTSNVPVVPATAKLVAVPPGATEVDVRLTIMQGLAVSSFE